MKKRDWIIYVLLPLLATWGADRITKMWAENIIGMNFYGPVGLVLHHNHGAILGLFSNLPPVLRVVSLATGGAFLLFSFFIAQYLLPNRSLLLRSGMSILIGGILGNVSDRIVWGYVVDFLMFGNPQKFSPAMNIADILQWVGYAFIVTALMKEGKILWPDENNRKSYWVNPNFQIRYCLTLMGFGLGLSIIAATFSYTYMRVTIEDLIGVNPVVREKFLLPYVATFAVIALGFSLMLFFVGLVLSHRSAGPIRAFENFLHDLAAGKFRNLKLRNKDDFTHLEEVAKSLTEKFQSNFIFKHPEADLDVEEVSTDQLDLPIESDKEKDS